MNRVNQQVKFSYLNKLLTGVVQSSFRHGIEYSHHIQLDKPIEVRKILTHQVIIKESDIIDEQITK